MIKSDFPLFFIFVFRLAKHPRHRSKSHVLATGAGHHLCVGLFTGVGIFKQIIGCRYRHSGACFFILHSVGERCFGAEDNTVVLFDSANRIVRALA